MRQDKAGNIFISIFLIFWAYIWLLNFFRDISHHSEETKKLCARPLAEKWEYIFGEDLYELLAASKKLIPEQEKVFFAHNLDRFKAKMAGYFLYPRQFSPEADFIMVYKQEFDTEADNKIIYSKAADIFIIKK